MDAATPRPADPATAGAGARAACLARGAERARHASAHHVGLADADFRFVLSSDV